MVRSIGAWRFSVGLTLGCGVVVLGLEGWSELDAGLEERAGFADGLEGAVELGWSRAREAQRRPGSAAKAFSAVANLLPNAPRASNGEGAPPSVSAGHRPFSYLYPRRDSNPRYRLESPFEE